MKIAVAGKGGVGKTTISAGLCLLMAQQERNPRAVDADPNNCLGYALGFPPELLDDLTPLSEMRALLAERAGSKPGQGGMFILAPPIADLITRYEISYEGISLLVMGAVDEGGSGCMCPENATLRTILRELAAEDRDLVVDMVAGLEHLGRGTAEAVDGLLAVAQPTGAAMRTVRRIIRLAADIGIQRIWILGNNATDEREADLIRRSFSDLPVIGVLPHYDGLVSEDGFEDPARLLADLGDVLHALDEYHNQEG